jgi:hypothetical protein
MPTSDHADKPVRNAPVWLKVVVAIHLVCITIWALPNPPQGVSAGTDKPVGSQYLLLWNQKHLKSFQPVPLYLFTTGTWQYWDMFSPNPASIDIWVDAEVTYKDGSKNRYAYPRMYELPIHEKFLKERYRKFYERVNQEQYAYLWPVFAQRIAVKMDQPDNPPVEVRLTRHWQQIAGPGEKPNTEYKSYMYYVHAVDKDLLMKARSGFGK